MIGAEQMRNVLDEIGTDTYENLIIDLRDNGGGVLEGPVVLGQFLTAKTIDGGCHLTRKWFDRNRRPATSADIQSLPFLKDFTVKGIKKMFREEAGFRMVIPGHDRPVFKGKTYVLVNTKTASANEPLVAVFKREGIATLVGSKTAGRMLNGAWFSLGEDYTLFIPTADYLTARGNRLDKVGIQPDIEVAPGQELDHVLNLLQEGSR